MNKIKVCFLLAAIIICGHNFQVFGQATVPFDCSEVGMIVTQSGIPNSTSSTFSRITVDRSTTPGTLVVTKLFDIPYNINATAYNPKDGFIYSFKIGSMTEFYRIDVKGNYDVLTAVQPGTLPQGNSYKGAAMNNNNILYLTANGASDDAIFYIDLNVTNAQGRYPTTNMALGGTAGLPDIVWNAANNTLYGVENNVSGQLGKVCVIALAAGGKSVSSFGRIGTAVSAAANTYSFGGVFIDYSDGSGSSNGKMYGTLNDENSLWQYDLTTGARTQITSSWKTGQGATSINDGASCPSLWADIAVTKDDGITSLSPGNSTTYTVVVSNAGPAAASGVQLSDPLPSGIPATNVSYTAVASGGAVTQVTGAQTGAINDVVTLPVGASVTYTAVLTVPASFSGTALENTVNATLNSSIFDPNLSNNVATDEDTIISGSRDLFIPVNPHVRGHFR